MGAAQQAKSNTIVASSLPPIEPSGTATCPVGLIRFGIFFDGTNNNAYRDWGPGFLSWKPGSGAPGENSLALNKDPKKNDPMDPPNAPTNVAKLYYLFKENADLERRIYEIGVGGGTTASSPGSAHGMEKGKEILEAASGLGASNKIQDAQFMLTQFVNRAQHALAVEKRVDVFGFSRGAAEARDFVNDTIAKGIEYLSEKEKIGYKWERDWLGRSKKIPTYRRMGGILFEFMGIFDTVASMGAGAVREAGNALAGYDMFVKGRPADKKKTPKEVLAHPPEPQFVHDKEGWVHRTFHAIADDEHRDLFPIELLGLDPKTRGYVLLPEIMREQSYPGAHSDVGGGYRRTPGQKYEPDKPIKKKTWYGREYDDVEKGKPEIYPQFGNLPHIPLKDMHAEAKLGFVPLDDVETLPKGLWEIQPDGAPKDADLQGLYDSYIAFRTEFLTTLLGKTFPKWADHTKDFEHDPVYVQALPESMYQAFVRARDKNEKYQLLSAYYIHKPSEETMWVALDIVRRAVRVGAAAEAGTMAGVGPAAGFALLGDSRDLNLVDTARQRDVHFMGYQNSYESKCYTVK